ncbi:M23 family metallopeptidase [Candidatus Peregrinibacteria bacterium]|nr:M23 family metallopeptidase [Candidatus Peregrinibacteria bacterium]
MHISPRAIFAIAVLILLSACSEDTLVWPLPEADSRPTPLHFGLYVTPDPAQNPIDPPERFTGFHTAVDFEIFETETDALIPVFAICSGRVLSSGSAEGYGGVVITRCRMRGQVVTVLYGHLDPESLPRQGSLVRKGNQIGILAAARSAGSGGNRKHLHLGIHKGPDLEFLGYVQTEAELEAFVDPLHVLPSGIPF